ncbi:MAG: transposase [Planctomycetota bacterium]
MMSKINLGFNREEIQECSHTSLAALGPVIESRRLFAPIYEQVKIDQKKIFYSPNDKLIFVVLGILSGVESVSDINYDLRPDKPVLSAFGFDSCADQSVIQDTIDACQVENVIQLEGALLQIFCQQNKSQALLFDALVESRETTIDMDLSGLPASKNAEGSSKGYFSKRRGTYGRQLARIIVPDTQEIVAESLYPGNILSLQVFKEMVAKMEKVLQLATKEHRHYIRLRLDGGFGTDENINFALWRGYELLAKMFSGKRARKLAQSVEEWVDVPTSTPDGPRQAGWVTTPKRYSRKTRQVAIRKPKPKKKDGFAYAIIVTTDMESDLHQILRDYDARSGIPESSFCQDNQGLGLRKRRKHKFVAQQMLILLSQLAHNLIQWIKDWMIKALQQKEKMEQKAEQMSKRNSWAPTETEKNTSTKIQLAIQSIKERGIKRFVKQIFALSGKIITQNGKIKRLILNPFYPMIDRIKMALQALLESHQITVTVGKT